MSAAATFELNAIQVFLPSSQTLTGVQTGAFRQGGVMS
jgi:hypothetical protein